MRVTHSDSVRLSPAIRLLLCVLLIGTWLPLSGFSAPGVNPTPTDADRITQPELSVLRASSAPTVTARAATLVDVDTGRVLWSLDGDRRYPMASTTKMMTALLATELAEPDDMVTVFPRDLVGGSTANLQVGETLAMSELLYAALLPSGNDAAVTIADYIGREYLGGVGDAGVATFVRAMNVRARKMGLTNTQFRNPNGFDEPGHYSTAHDLAILGRAVLRDPLLADVVATTTYTVTGYTGTGRDRTPIYHPVTTTNELLGTYRGANGIKTGTTVAAGEVLVASARRGYSKLIAVVLNSRDRFGDARALLDWGYATYEWLPLFSRLFVPPSLAPPTNSQPAYAAVESWNTDLTFGVAQPGVPRYWAATEPLDVAPITEGVEPAPYIPAR